MDGESVDPLIRLLQEGNALEVTLDGRPHRFHAVWLRDNALDPATRSPQNGQRLITLRDIDPATRIAEARWSEDYLTVRFDPDGKIAQYDAAWLLAHSYDTCRPAQTGWTASGVIRWDGSQPACVLPAEYREIQAKEQARLHWLRTIQTYGFARLTGVPIRSGVPAEIAALFGYVRETNYGRIFDVRVAANPENLADTNLGLQAHTDNPYRDPVPGLQILVCLQNDVEGGDSLVVDGFRIAAQLQAEWPQDFALLAGTNARFDYQVAHKIRLRSKKPLIELGVDGELLGIRFNNRSAAPFTDVSFDRMADYYRAYRRMAELLDDPSMAIRFKLRPGEAFIVDNLRVLHARTAITSHGDRHLQGCYADKDGLLSTIAVLGTADGVT